MTNFQNIIALFITLVVVLSMGLQFYSFEKEGFKTKTKTKTNTKNSDSIPIHKKQSVSMATHSVYDEASNY